jgi:hypothetical protein
MLDDAYWWYEQQLPGLGERLLDEVDICFDKLQHTPFYYSIDKENYRQIMLKHFPYKVIFEISEKAVIIYALFHTSRDPNSITG